MYSRAVQRDPQERWLTLTDIENHVGLRTNVHTTTKLQFTKHIGQIAREWAERHDRNERRKGK
jgi:hypothetical protein